MSISKNEDQNYHHGDLRNTLIQAGVALLKQHGMDKLSLRKLAREAGVSHNAPYMHFKDKEGLLAAITAEGFDMLADDVRQATSGDFDNWYDQFMSGCNAYVSFVLENTGHAQVMFRDYDAQQYPEAARAASEALSLLQSSIQEGQNTGHVIADDSHFQATVVWSFLHGIAVILASDKMPDEIIAGHTTETLLANFLAQLYAGLQPRTD